MSYGVVMMAAVASVEAMTRLDVGTTADDQALARRTRRRTAVCLCSGWVKHDVAGL